jgi:hypothetical protein
MRYIRRAGIAAVAVTCVATSLLASASAQAISGGTPAADGTYGFVAKIMMDGRACTGALIDPQWVVTASSCFPENAQQAGVPAKPATATVGRTNLTTTTGQVVRIAGLVPRPDRNLVLAKLGSPITDVAPIPLATTAAASGSAVKVAGFGRTATEWVPDQLRVAPLLAAAATDTTLALTSDTGIDTCLGDAGGPAMREANGRLELVGVHSASWQHGCLAVTETRQGSTESRVDNIADWIVQQIQPRPVQFKNHVTGRCLLAWARENVNEAPIRQTDCDPPYLDQVWDLVPVSNGFQVRSRANERCLLARGGAGNVNDAQVMQFDCDSRFADQVWDLVPASNGFQVRNRITERCLLVRGGAGNVNGALVVQFDCNPVYEDQVWDLVPIAA